MVVHTEVHLVNFFMRKEHLSDVVRQVGWLSKLPEPLQDALLARASMREHSKGEAIYLQGDPPGSLYGLVSGSLGVTASLGPAAPRLIHVARPGWWVGEAAMVSQTQTRVEVNARMPSHVLAVGAGAIAELARTTPELWRWLGLLTVSHMDSALKLAGCVLAPKARDRVAATLLRLAEPAPGDGAAIALDITQGELAEMCGLSRNPVGAVLQDLCARGAVECGRRRILVQNLDVLVRIGKDGC